MHLPAVGKQISPIHVVDIGGVLLVRSSAEFRSSGGPPVLDVYRSAIAKATMHEDAVPILNFCNQAMEKADASSPVTV